MFIFSIVISCLLINYSAAAAAPESGVPNGKSMYSSRPNRTVRTRPEETPILAPATDQTVVRSTPTTPTPVIPERLNSLTSDPFLENKTFSNKSSQFSNSSSDFSDISSMVSVPAPPNQSDKPRPSQELVIEKTEVRPLSKIDVNPMSHVRAERTEVYKKTDESSDSNFISRPAFSNQSVLAEDYKSKQEDQLDELNARLAKIQLEKHNLNETLKLISKIKSSAIKAKTLVDLAEYVSRDNNYKKEADQLFALAADGIDALTKGEAIVIKIKDDLKTESVLVPNTRMSGSTTWSEPKKPDESTSITPLLPTTSPTPPSKKTSITLLEEEKPIELPNPKTESASKTIQKPNESPAVTYSTSAVPSTPSTSTKKTLTLMDDEPETKPVLEEKNNEIKKETATSSSVPSKRPAILLGGEPELPKSEIIKEEKPAESKIPPTRKPSLLLTEEPEINKEKETETKITEPVKTETIKTETIKPSDTPPSTSKPPRRTTMPGRPKVIPEEN
jgi:hypothetical protein